MREKFSYTHIQSWVFLLLAVPFASLARDDASTAAPSSNADQSKAVDEKLAEVERKVKAIKQGVARIPYGSERHRNFLSNRFGFKDSEIAFHEKYPMIIREGLRDQPDVINPNNPVTELQEFDAVIIGSGPAGLTSGVYLTEAGLRVLVLEKNRDLGGLAATGNRTGVQYARGGAYFANADGELLEIYKKIGIGDYDQQFPIPEPIDTYDWNGILFDEIWSDKTVAKLPAPFAMLRYALNRMDSDNRVPDQPFENFPWLEETDSLTMARWVRRIPKMMEYWAADDEVAKQIMERFQTESGFDPEDPMAGPLGLLELYGRSALGDHPTEVSAAAFINFYLNELETRYTGSRGAGEVSWSAYQTLLKQRNLARFKTGAKVTRIENIWKDKSQLGLPDYVEVSYIKDGVAYKVKAKDVVFSAPLRLAQKAIVDYEKLAPEHHKLTSEIEYRDYMVINVHVAGHPWVQAYDLWVRNDKNYDQKKITDIIDGRWMDFKGRELPRTDDRGILTIYMPLDRETSRGRTTKEDAMRIANDAIEQMKAYINPHLRAQGKEEITVLAAEINYWEDAIHVVKPGHFSNAQKLKNRVGRIHFANNNLGTPSIEEALFRGKDVAEQVRRLHTCEGPLTRKAN